jgi:AAA15 family ATPase/GTPase
MIKNIKIKNLRAITELKIDNFGQVNLLVGENNCGKTTALEALFFLIGNTNPNLPVKANQMRGLPYLHRSLWPTYFHNITSTLPIEITWEDSDTNKESKLYIQPIKKNQEITQYPSDVISLEPKKKLESVSGESTPSTDIVGLEYFNSDRNSICSIYEKDNELHIEGVKESIVKGFFLSPSQSYDLKDKFDGVQRKKQVDEVVTLLKQIDPRITDLRLNQIGFVEADIDLPELIPINLMGGGMIKVLNIALAMLNFKNGVVLIDEFENGLRHSIQEALWKTVFTWARDLNVQVFATTHSQECIKAFTKSAEISLFEMESKLFRIERQDEIFRVVEYSRQEVAESLDSNWEVR